jgi:copper transport protein
VATWVDDAGQFLIYLGVLVAAGLAFFVAFILLDEGEGRRLRGWAAGATGVAAVGMVMTVGAQASQAYGGITAIAHWSALWPAIDGKLGAQLAAQCIGLAVCLASLVVRPRLARQFAAFYGVLVAAGAFVLFGHALVSRERWLSAPADVVHVVFAAMWAGGLIGLVSVLRRHIQAARSAGDLETRRAGPARGPATVAVAESGAPSGAAGTASTAVLERDPPPAGDYGGGQDRFAATVGILNRFSTMAGISFAAIVVAGILLGIAEVGSVANLFDTGYGQLLLLKVAIVGVLLVLAWYNRMLLLPMLVRTASQGRTELRSAWRRLLGTVRLEALGVIAVLGVTSVLANHTPSNGAPSRLPPPKPFAQSQPFNGGRLQLKISPNEALVNQWTVTITDAEGRPQSPESVSVYVVQPERNIGPIETDLRRTGPGTFELPDSPDPPVVGRWQIVVQVQVSAFSQLDASFTDTVNP